MSLFNIGFQLELIDIQTDPKHKEVSLWLRCRMCEYQASICVATIPYDNETERQVVISKMEKAAKHLQDLQQWQEEKLTTKR